MGSGESDAFYQSKKLRTEYEEAMARKAAQRKPPKNPTNPEKEYIRRKGKP